MKKLVALLLLYATCVQAHAGGFPALFTSAKKYTITSSAGANGTITASAKVKAHSSKTFTILGSAGYLIDALTVDGVGVDTAATYVFSNVTANHTISVTFKQAGWAITVSAAANGTITPGTTVVAPNGEQVFTIAGNAGCSVDSVYADGVSDSAGAFNGSHTFSNVTAAHTLSAVFIANLVDYFPATANGGFEAGGESPFAYWTISSDGVARDTNDAHGGSHALALVGPTWGTILTAVSVVPGKSNRMSVWMKVNNVSGNPTIRFFDHGSTVYQTVTPTTTWTQYVCTFTAVGNRIDFLIGVNSNTTFFIDDVRLWQIN